MIHMEKYVLSAHRLWESTVTTCIMWFRREQFGFVIKMWASVVKVYITFKICQGSRNGTFSLMEKHSIIIPKLLLRLRLIMQKNPRLVILMNIMHIVSYPCY